MTKKQLKRVLIIVTALIMGLSLVSCGGSDTDEKKVTIGGKNFTEQDIIVNLVADVIEANTDITVDRKTYLGGTSVVAGALESGDIDIEVEYTGTGLMSVLKLDPETDKDKVYNIVKDNYDKKFEATWMKPLGFNNTYAIAMTEKKAKELGIKSISDLKKYNGKLKFGGSQEFMERPDGYKEFSKNYDLSFKDSKGMDPGLLSQALKEGDVDIATCFATDGRIPVFKFILLEDNKSFFPPYDAAIVCRNDTLDKYPELQEAFDKLDGQISDEEMAKMNAKVDLDDEKAADVANAWLKEKGII